MAGTTITSPNYPSNYDVSEDCQVTIRFGSDERVKIQIEGFDVESNLNCDYDYLVVHDGDSTSSPKIGLKLCGTSPSGTIMESSGNTMTLYFHSDSWTTRTGFRIYANVSEGTNIMPNLSGVKLLLYCIK